MSGRGERRGRKDGWNRLLAPFGNRIRLAECGRCRHANAGILFGHGEKGLTVLLIGQHRRHPVKMEPVMAVMVAAGKLAGRHRRSLTVAGAFTTMLQPVHHDLFLIMVAETYAERIEADEHRQRNGTGLSGGSVSVILHMFLA